MKKFAIFLSVTLLILGVAVPASAGQRVDWYDVTTDETWPQVDCSAYGFDYTVMNHAVIREKGEGWFDDAGSPYKTFDYVTGTNTLYNENDPSIAVSGDFSFRIHAEPVSPGSSYWTWKFTGVQWHVQLPGYGAVLHQSGQMVLLADGWNPIGFVKEPKGLVRFDYQALCAGLAE